MAINNSERFEQIIGVFLEYILFLKQELATAKSNDASDAEAIAQANLAAEQFKQMYDSYVNSDNEDDSTLTDLFARAEARL
jgi:hypothetical protein